VTIVAGFTYNEGILLCADTEYTSNLKLYASKIFAKEYDDGTKSVIALTGSQMYARMGIQDIEYGIEALPTPRTFLGIRDVVLEAIGAVYPPAHISTP
jgi:hypothetical protein